jgi:hypothetical protein
MQPPSAVHGTGHIGRVLLWAWALARGTPHQDAVLWAAACHDLMRFDDGPDPEHGRRAGLWVRNVLPEFLGQPPADLETIASACDWHVDPDSRAEWRHPVLWLLKDADGLDRARLGDLDPRYLRSPEARELVPAAWDLANRTRGQDEPELVWRAAADMGLPVSGLARWVARAARGLRHVPQPAHDSEVWLLALQLAGPGRLPFILTGLRPHLRGVSLRLVDQAGLLTPGLEAEAREAGVLAMAFEGHLNLCPAVPLDPRPAAVWHLTPAANEAAILAGGLKRGLAAGVSSSLRLDAGGHIHVCLSADDARHWAAPHLLGKAAGPGWVLIEVDAARLPGRVLLDPASSTGCLLEDAAVPPELLRVVERFTVSS